MIRKELRERFIEDLAPAERIFFLKRAGEAAARGYPASEDLFHYCYFLTLKERLRGFAAPGGEGCLRFLRVEGMKEIEEAIKLYLERLEARKIPGPGREAERFIEQLSE